ncbi:uncharacterized protein isoform X1 [Choristoneura fumiferana]|uniref:uncharacterized protein isoform X1 n=1 Tax=Choristoneura fumiferana TaxID=7141 RepID=UPI003D15BD47
MGLNLYSNYLLAAVFTVNLCFASNVFERDPGPPRENEGFVYKLRQERSASENDSNTSTSKEPSYKKWQVGRVSRKQFEIVNMLWRKTKVNMDVESTTAGDKKNNNYNGTKILYKRHENNWNFRHKGHYISRPVFHTSTPSYIEFYYLDEKVDPVKDTSTDKFDKFFNIRRTTRLINYARDGFRHSPLFSFRVDSNYKRPTSTSTTKATPQPVKKKKRGNPREQELINTLTESRNYSNLKNILKPENRIKLTDLIKNNTLFGKRLITVKVYLNGSRKSRTKQTVKHTPKTTTMSTTTSSTTLESTTAYDKIKFFELYDSLTLAPQQDALKNKNDIKNIIDSEDIEPKKDKVRNIVQNIGNCNNQSRNNRDEQSFNFVSFTTESKTNASKLRFIKRKGSTHLFQDKNALDLLLNTTTKRSPSTDTANKNKLAAWSNYPFVSVYVYEPTQTHCDAAGISPHWLIAAGSCLSRHHLVHSVEARSAFVTYCGDNWRNPERIAYVKYSVVHPKFHPKDEARRHLYNIGLIQVSSPMTTCSNWSPISLMSHHFAADSQGSIASAVGWGLDRFGTKYMTEKLPLWPLTVYEGLVYSDSCPGSIAYSKAKRQDPDSGVNNVYCLLLPPYTGEETDPAHGGLLLVGGKLIALYLQEERRSWGAQSAQYTGVWRVIPWVMDAAREPEDSEAFSSDV